MDLVVKFALVLAGLVCAAFAELLAFGMAGAGEGWLAPFFYSILLFIAYPLVFVRTVGVSRHWVVVDLLLMAVAVLTDVLLIYGTYSGEATYFMRVWDLGLFAPMWIGVWGLWQVVTAHRLWRTFGKREDPFYG
jgi:hypothetical protein